jgi:hypothetical protein
MIRPVTSMLEDELGLLALLINLFQDARLVPSE